MFGNISFLGFPSLFLTCLSTFNKSPLVCLVQAHEDALRMAREEAEKRERKELEEQQRRKLEEEEKEKMLKEFAELQAVRGRKQTVNDQPEDGGVGRRVETKKTRNLETITDS